MDLDFSVLDLELRPVLTPRTAGKDQSPASDSISIPPLSPPLSSVGFHLLIRKASLVQVVLPVWDGRGQQSIAWFVFPTTAGGPAISVGSSITE